MNYAIHRISLDVTDDSPSQLTIAAKQGDTAKILIISLLDDKKNYQIAQGSVAVFIAKKSNGVWLEHPCTIDYKSNKVLYTFKEDTVRTSGTMECEIHLSRSTFLITEDGKTEVVHEDLTTASFVIAVHDTILTGLTGTTEEVSLLPGLITTGSRLFAELEGKTIPNANNAAQEARDATAKTEQAIANANELVEEIQAKLENGELGSDNLKNGEGNYSVQQKAQSFDWTNPETNEVEEVDGGAKANGIGSVAFGGVRYDKLDKYDPVNNPGTTVNGNQAFGTGANVIVDGDFGFGVGKDLKNYQKANAVFGGGNIVGDPDSDESYGFCGVGGDSNWLFGRGNFGWGAYMNVGGQYNVYFGEEHNKAADKEYYSTCRNLLVSGHGHNLYGSYESVVSGSYNDLYWSKNTYLGGNGNVGTNLHGCFVYAYESDIWGDYCFVFGTRHYNRGSHNILIGGGCNDNGHSSVRLIGEGLQGGRNNQVVVGHYNDPKSNTVFEVGIGGKAAPDGEVERHNGFEITDDGRARVYGAPQNPEDVVRKKELDELENGNKPAGKAKCLSADNTIVVDIASDNLSTTYLTDESREWDGAFYRRNYKRKHVVDLGQVLEKGIYSLLLCYDNLPVYADKMYAAITLFNEDTASNFQNMQYSYALLTDIVTYHLIGHYFKLMYNGNSNSTQLIVYAEEVDNTQSCPITSFRQLRLAKIQECDL